MRRSFFVCTVAISSITFASSARGQVEHFSVTSAQGISATTESVSFLVDTDGPLDGWSFGLCHDPALLSVVSAEVGADAAAVNPAFTSIEAGLSGGITVGSLISLVPPFDQLLPGSGLELLRVTYELIGPPGTISSLDPCGTLGSPPVVLLLVVDGVETPPTFSSGSLEILGGPMFIRGDANGDGLLNIIDAVRVLELIFVGVDPITCADLIDTNDDEIVNLLDVIYLLQVAITGVSVMPAPFPECGLDPTDTGPSDCAEIPTPCL